MQKLKESENMKNEKKKLYIQNKMFKKDTNRFRRHLRTKSIEVTACPRMKQNTTGSQYGKWKHDTIKMPN
jgi:hypothetical protein